MSRQLKCEECESETFLVNGWQVTEELIEQEPQSEVYGEEDVGNADIVEVVCDECGNAIMTVEGGRM